MSYSIDLTHSLRWFPSVKVKYRGKTNGGVGRTKLTLQYKSQRMIEYIVDIRTLSSSLGNLLPSTLCQRPETWQPLREAVSEYPRHRRSFPSTSSYAAPPPTRQAFHSELRGVSPMSPPMILSQSTEKMRHFRLCHCYLPFCFVGPTSSYHLIR